MVAASVVLRTAPLTGFDPAKFFGYSLITLTLIDRARSMKAQDQRCGGPAHKLMSSYTQSHRRSRAVSSIPPIEEMSVRRGQEENGAACRPVPTRHAVRRSLLATWRG